MNGKDEMIDSLLYCNVLCCIILINYLSEYLLIIIYYILEI